MPQNSQAYLVVLRCFFAVCCSCSSCCKAFTKLTRSALRDSTTSLSSRKKYEQKFFLNGIRFQDTHNSESNSILSNVQNLNGRVRLKMSKLDKSPDLGRFDAVLNL